MPGKAARLNVKTNSRAENSVDGSRNSDRDEEPVLRKEVLAELQIWKKPT